MNRVNQVVIVEDEAYVRSSLQRLIDWKSIDCEVSGAFASAEEALAYPELGNIDLILSDIRMDGMDGVEFAGRVKELHPGIRFIFLTGYSEFSYAQAAVKLRADDFILKPTDPEELARTVQRVVREIEAARAEAETVAGLRDQAGVAREVLRGRFLLDLSDPDQEPDGKSAGHIGERARELGLPAGPLFPVAFALDADDAQSEAIQLKQLVGAIASDSCVPCAASVSGPDRYLCAIAGQSGVEVAAFAGRIIEGASKILCRVTAGIGPRCAGWEDYRFAVPATLEALESRWYLGTGRIIHTEDTPCKAGSDSLPSPGSALHTVEDQASIPAFLDLVRSGDGQGALKLLENMAEQLRSRGNPLADRSFIADLLGLLLAIRDGEYPLAGSSRQGLVKIRSTREAAGKAPTLEAALTIVAKIVREISSLADRVSTSSGTRIASGALEFMAENFARPIGVDDVAAAVSKHPKHLCRVVKEETGCSVMDHLLVIRMKKSLEYLADPTLAIAEVARKVGIPDAQYFAKLFRKTYGITPSEHRASGSMLQISTKPLPPSIHGSENP